MTSMNKVIFKACEENLDGKTVTEAEIVSWFEEAYTK
jgi:hypothetical protein